MMFLAYLFCALALADQPASEPASADKKTAAASDNKALTKTVNEASFKPPSPSFIPPPVYPEAAIAEGLSGSVLMAIDIAADGSVVAVEVLEADREDFAQAALDNARSFVFEPARLADGTAVDARIEYRTVFQAEKVAPISVSGQVREAGPRIPLKRARVVVANPEGERVIADTDDEGRFRIAGLSPGPWVASVSAAGHVTETFDFVAVEGKVATVSAYLVRDEVRTGQVADDEIVVVAAAPETEVTERTLTAEEVRYLPGSGGDVVKVVQNLPGIARSPLGTGNLRIRGTAPEDSLYFLDGGQIPIVFHFSGLTTVLASDLLEEVAYLPGSYTVRYGRALGGLVDLRTERALPERSNGYVSVDVFQTALYVQQRVGKRDAVTASARRSYADVVLNPILNDGNLTVQAPRYYDAQLRWSRKLDAGWSDVMFLLSDDRFRFLGQGDDEVVLAGFATQFQKLRWLTSRSFGDGLSLDASVVMGPEKKFFESDGSSEAYEKEMRIATRLELRQEATPDRTLGWTLGTDPNFNRSSFLYDIARPPERTVSTARTAPRESGANNIWQPSAYGELSLRAGQFKFLPGIRTDAQVTGSHGLQRRSARPRALGSQRHNDAQGRGGSALSGADRAS